MQVQKLTKLIFEYDGADGGTAGLGAVTMSGAFGTLTFDDGGVGNLFDGDYSNHDISYATTVNGVAISVAADADESVTAGELVQTMHQLQHQYCRRHDIYINCIKPCN